MGAYFLVCAEHRSDERRASDTAKSKKYPDQYPDLVKEATPRVPGDAEMFHMPTMDQAHPAYQDEDSKNSCYISPRVFKKYPDRVPVLVKQLRSVGLPDIDKKLLVLRGMRCDELLEVLPNTIGIDSPRLRLYIGDIALKDDSLLSEVYSEYVDDFDGGLHVTIRYELHGEKPPEKPPAEPPADKEDERELLKHEKKMMQNEIDSLKEQLAIAQEKVKEQLELVQEHIDAAESRADAAENKASVAERRASTASEDTLTAELRALQYEEFHSMEEEKVRQFQEEMDNALALQSECAIWQRRVEQEKDTHSDTRLRLHASLDEVTTWEYECDMWKGRAEQAEKVEATLREEVKYFRDEFPFAKQEQAEETLSAAVNEDSQVKTPQKDNFLLCEELRLLRDECNSSNSCSSEISAWQVECNSWEQTAKEMQAECAFSKQEAVQVKTTMCSSVNKLLEEVAALKSNNNILEWKAEQGEETNHKLKQELEEFRKLKDASNKDPEVVSARVAALQSECDYWKRKAERAE